QIAGEQRDSQDGGSGDAVSKRVHGADLEKDRAHEAHGSKCGSDSEDGADSGEKKTLADEHGGEVVALRAESHADSDFASTLGDGVGDDSVDTDDTEEKRHASGDAEHDECE